MLLEYGVKFKRKKLSKDDEEKMNAAAAASSQGKSGGGRLAGFEKKYANATLGGRRRGKGKNYGIAEKELLQQMSALKIATGKVPVFEPAVVRCSRLFSASPAQ